MIPYFWPSVAGTLLICLPIILIAVVAARVQEIYDDKFGDSL